MTTVLESPEVSINTQTMRAAVFHGVDDIRLEEVPRPRPVTNAAVIRITTTTICGTDVHILKGTFPPGSVPITLGHEFAGRVVAAGSLGRPRNRRRSRDGGHRDRLWDLLLLPPSAAALLPTPGR